MRIYPNVDQQKKIDNTINCCRSVYNRMIDINKKVYSRRGEHLSYYDMQNLLPKLKKQFHWLKDADAKALQYECRNLDTAFQNFFSKRSGFPNYKKKRTFHQSYTTMQSYVEYDGKRVKLPLVGWVKSRGNRDISEKICYVTISKNKCGEYFLSITYKFDEDDVPEVEVTEDRTIGLDYKSNGLYTDSNGVCCNSPKHYRKSHDRLKRLQRKYSHCLNSHITGYDKDRRPSFDRKLRYCKNLEKHRLAISKLQKHIANQRKDFLHKLSYEIANRYDVVCVEDLNMRSLSNKGFGNGKATLDNGYGTFLTFLKYKLGDRGKHLIKVDKFFPSSQLCSKCGFKNPALKDMSIREWICPECGTEHDRDINAAINIKNEGLRLLIAA